ncbi:MAG: hypothetical protein DRH57_03090 [Candidatus Cloacimonadota bacterium]|nr:MAG: hypothetical protein DRH57_03090 [Candidatus Cloacimonadota bacterium]
MNPFEELLKEAHLDHQPQSLQINIGDYVVDTSLLLTDDLAAIFNHFRKDEAMIGELVEYASSLPYSTKIDMMFYLGSDKKSFRKLKKIKSFQKFLDDFSEIIADIKYKS